MENENNLSVEQEKQLVLVVDDEPDMLSMLKLVLQKKLNCEVITAPTGLEALELFKTSHPDVVLTDIKMPDLDGLELLQQLRDFDTETSVVIMTGYGTIDMAVQALKNGAYDFLQKPFDKDRIVHVMRKCLERTSLLRANKNLKARLASTVKEDGFIGQSPQLQRVRDLIARIADTDATILIRGESGTGKEVAAQALHNLSPRRSHRMITVNCPALPENVLESELFGYSKGAFTGALQNKKGLFLEADQSTILLDEIGDIPVSVQTKLLRVLQEKEILPLGQTRTIKVDVRVVASTNQDLEAKIAAGEFREDLFYRLNVVTLTMPNLVDIREDIPLLVHHFLEKFKHQYDRPDLTLPLDVLQCLYQRHWQGNVRELQNAIKRIVLLASSGSLTPADLDTLIQDCKAHPASAAPPTYTSLLNLPYNEAKCELVKQFSSQYLHQLLTLHHGNVTEAAASCGIERQALQRLMRRYGFKSTDYRN